MKTLAVGDRLETVTRHVAFDKMVEFERVVWDRGINSHNDVKAAQKDGITRPIASGQNQMAFLHEMLEKNFGDAWVYGGRISARWIHPVYVDDRITPNGIVAELKEVDGKARVVINLWCENQDGEKTAVGTAEAGQPSASRSWLDQRGAAA